MFYTDKMQLFKWFNSLTAKKYLKTRYFKITAGLVVSLFIFIIYWFSLPTQIFKDPYSTVLYSSDGQLIGAMIADDGQWRFPQITEVPEKFKKALICFEDQYFYKHPGVNLYSLCRAAWVNTKEQRVVMGGSTLTMQMIRVSRKAKSRNVFQKSIEIILASRVELKYSKDEILSMYISNAPFGGNIVGLEAASWRYFGRAANELSWAEAATLAILPNAPALVFSEKNHKYLLNKRNKLLAKLYVKKVIDFTTYKLSLLEQLPLSSYSYPQLATHLLTTVTNSKLKQQSVKTTLNRQLQLQVDEIINKHSRKLSGNGIYNMACVVAEVETGNVLAYIGNSDNFDNKDHGNAVDIIRAPRSTGSILKPFLYAASLDDGLMLPGTLVPDIPVMMAGYSPKNYSRTFDGAVHAQRALSRSLNVPSVFMLDQYSVDKFYSLLKRCGLSTLTYPASRYGLSLILGGAEGNLWDIAGVYASMGRTLLHFRANSGKYALHDFRSLSFVNDTSYKPAHSGLTAKGIINASAIWLTFKALLEVNRPEDENGWEYFLSSKKVAWKTGTSFGFRDAWAVGTTAQYVVAVWAGNADGEGRSGLTGTDCAAPVLFDIFQLLPDSRWFEQPYDEMTLIPVCRQSGYRQGANCTETDSVWVQNNGLRTLSCPFHKLIHLDKTGKYQVTSNCESTANMQHVNWFVLPPVQEWYFKSKNSNYKSLPPFKPECADLTNEIPMEFIYPKNNASIFIPTDIDSTKSRVIFEIAHRKPDKHLYWHMDGTFIGTTQNIHQIALNPEKGKHTLTVVDEDGKSLQRVFLIK